VAPPPPYQALEPRLLGARVERLPLPTQPAGVVGAGAQDETNPSLWG
jgi:hypothetical protein